MIGAALLATGASQLQATTVFVTNTNDNGAGSLRGALATAADGDTINFSVTGTIALTSRSLLVTNSVDIIGPGPDLLAVNGNRLSVFRIGSNTVVSISGLTITNGFAEHGGGINNDHATLTVSNVILSGNSAFGGVEGGGGIYNDGRFRGSATLLIIDSTLSGNSANASGGAVGNDTDRGGRATLIVNNCTLSGNSTGFFPGEGGAIYNHGVFGTATVQVLNSTLTSNSASRFGGGIENGACCSGSASAEIVNSMLNGNSARFGDGGGIDIIGEGASVEVANSTLSGNSAGRDGGGIYNGGTVQVLDSTRSKRYDSECRRFG